MDPATIAAIGSAIGGIGRMFGGGGGGQVTTSVSTQNTAGVQVNPVINVGGDASGASGGLDTSPDLSTDTASATPSYLPSPYTGGVPYTASAVPTATTTGVSGTLTGEQLLILIALGAVAFMMLSGHKGRR